MTSNAATVEEYLAQLPEDRREAIAAFREVILANLPAGVEEGMQYGMIGYFIPHSRYPNGYHCDPKQPLPFVHLASQKAHMAFYAFCLYPDTELKQWFQEAYAAAGKKLDMGAACMRFKRLDQVPLDVIAQLLQRVTVEKFIEVYERSIPEKKRKK
jgi:hypothetical protein